MDAAERKRRLREYKEAQRAEAQAALPLSHDAMEAMFTYVERALDDLGCDHTRRFTHDWLVSQGHEVEAVFDWLDSTGGYCDCEVAANSMPNWQEAVGDAGVDPAS